MDETSPIANFLSSENTRKVFRVVVIFLVTVFLISFVYSFFADHSKRKEEENISENQATYYSIIPGYSSRSDVIKKLGDPVNETTIGAGTHLEYSSNNVNFNNEVEIENDSVHFIKEIVAIDDDITMKSLLDNYGASVHVLYGPEAINGFFLHVVPAQGVAYIAHPAGDIVLEIWYFQPTTLSKFRSKYAANYTDKYIPRQ